MENAGSLSEGQVAKKACESKDRSKAAKRPHTKALRKSKRHRYQTTHLLEKGLFRRLVREIAQDRKADIRFQSSAIDMIQEVAEAYMVKQFSKYLLAAFHAGRVTIMPKDIEYTKAMQGDRADGVLS